MGLGEQETSGVLGALSNATRRWVVDELDARDRQSLFELHTRLIEKYGLAQSRQGFSRHLATLEEAGIIEVEWSGSTKLHSLNRAPIQALLVGWLRKFEESSE
ncbi:MAG: helix-turn-helix domain-containing protein [Myxococcota bacterium]